MHYILKVIDCLEPLTFALGAVIGFLTFRRCRKVGYMVVAIYFCLAVFSLLALPCIKAELRARQTPTQSEETQRKINAAVAEAIDRVMHEEGAQPGATERDIKFPLGPLVLVFGVWLLARQEPSVERRSTVSEQSNT